MHALTVTAALSALLGKAAGNLIGRQGNNGTLLKPNATSTSESTITSFLTITSFETVPAQLPTTGTGLDYARACDEIKQDWQGSVVQGPYIDYNVTRTKTSLLRSTYFSTILETSPGATPYTLCDGYVRINGTSTLTSSRTTTTTVTTFVEQTVTKYYLNISRPTCTIGSTDCAALSSSWTSEYKGYTTWLSSSRLWEGPGPFTTPAPPSPTLGSPVCGVATYPKLFTTPGGEGPSCRVNGASLTLLYWPVTTSSGCNLCSIDGCPTRTMDPTVAGQPNSVVTLGTTLTSPTVYFAMSGAWDYTLSGTTYENHTRFIYPQNPTAVSSYCWTAGDPEASGAPMSFNFANLNEPIPAAAYRCQPRCWQTSIVVTNTVLGSVYLEKTWLPENQCSTIWNNYAPALTVPADLLSLNPFLNNEGNDGQCIFGGGVLFDPPIALQQTNAIAVPTRPGSTPADPTSSGSEQTTQPDPTSQQPGAQPTALPDQTRSTRSSGGQVTAAPPSPSDDPGNNAPNEPSQSRPTVGIPASEGPAPQQPSRPESSSRDVGNIIATVIGLNPSSDRAPQAPATGIIIALPSGPPATIIQSQNGVVQIGTATLAMGASASIEGVGNVVIQASGVLVDGTSQTFNALPTTVDDDVPAIITAGGQTFTAGPSGEISVNVDETLSRGGEITLSGTVYSMDEEGNMVIDGVTRTPLSPSGTAEAAVVTIDGHVVTEGPDHGFTVAPGATLTPGGTLVISGTTYSLDVAGDGVVINGVTQTLADVRTTSIRHSSSTDDTITASTGSRTSTAAEASQTVSSNAEPRSQHLMGSVLGVCVGLLGLLIA